MPVRVYNCATLTLSYPFVTDFSESIRAFPVEYTPNEPVQGRFDTVLVGRTWVTKDRPSMDGIHGTVMDLASLMSLTEFLYWLGFQVAQIRAIFTLPDEYKVSEPLVYAETFTIPYTNEPISHVDLHRIRRDMLGDEHVARVFPLSHVYRSVYLIPLFPSKTFWRSETALESCDTFYVNQYLDSHTFCLLF